MSYRRRSTVICAWGRLCEATSLPMSAAAASASGIGPCMPYFMSERRKTWRLKPPPQCKCGQQQISKAEPGDQYIQALAHMQGNAGLLT